MKKSYVAIIIIFLISLIYHFPALIGKVDTTIDIRDVRMYPWRHYSVDKKIKLITLWENLSPFDLTVLSNNIAKTSFNIEVEDSNSVKSKDIKESNFYLSFDFKPVSQDNGNFDFGLKLTNKITNISFNPGFAIVPIDESNHWFKATFNLNNLVNTFGSLNEINSYNVEIVASNKNSDNAAVLQIKNLKLIAEDFSSIIKVHNHYNNDLIQWFTPAREYYSNSLKKFKLPFWNNYIFTGSEFLSEPQMGYYHPLCLASYFLFDHFTAHEVITFVCLFLCGFGVFLLTKEWRFSFGASLLTAIVYMFQPANATWFSYEHTLINTATIPFLLYFYDKSLKETRFINKYLLISALLVGLVFISGHLQRVYYSLIFFALYIIFRFTISFIKDKKINERYIFGSIFIFIIGFMIGAVVLIPFSPLYLDSHRASMPHSLVKKVSLSMKALLGLVFPFYQGIPDWPLAGVLKGSNEYNTYKLGFMRNYIYFGFLPFLFFLLGILNSLKNKRNLFFVLLAVFSLLIAFGSPLYFILRDILPGFKDLQHYKVLMIYSICVPFISGFGFDIFLNLFSKIKLKKILISLILIITVIDLMYYSSYFITWSDRKAYKPIPKEGSIEFLLNRKSESNEPFRVLPFTSHKVKNTWLKTDSAEPNTLLPYGLEDASGYSSFIPKDIYYLLFHAQIQDKNKLYSGDIYNTFENFNTPYPISNYHSKIVDLLNVKYFLVPNFLTLESEKVKLVYSGDANIYENLNCLPRAFFVPSYMVIDSNVDTIVKLDSKEFNPMEEVILMADWHVIARSTKGTTKQSPSAIRNEIALSPMAPRNDVQFIKYQPENITLKVNVDKSGFLILGHNLNNNWEVKVNGKEGSHVQANLVQRAVYLPGAGEYLIDFYYFPILFFVGLFITLLGLVILFYFYTTLKENPRVQ